MWKFFRTLLLYQQSHIVPQLFVELMFDPTEPIPDDALVELMFDPTEKVLPIHWK